MEVAEIISKVLRTNLRGISAKLASQQPSPPPATLTDKSKDLSVFFIKRNESYGNYGSYRNYGNVAIKREQRLLADYAEREQRKDCEAGLIMG